MPPLIAHFQVLAVGCGQQPFVLQLSDDNAGGDAHVIGKAANGGLAEGCLGGEGVKGLFGWQFLPGKAHRHAEGAFQLDGSLGSDGHPAHPFFYIDNQLNYQKLFHNPAGPVYDCTEVAELSDT